MTFLSGSLAALVYFVGCARDCPIVDCTAPVVVELSLPAPGPAGGEVMACHQGSCGMGTLPDPLALGPVSFSGGDVFNGWLQAAADGSWQLTVNWGVGGEGDRYTVVVRDASGGAVASFDKTAHFSQGSLDGCPTCTTASFSN